MSSDMLHDMFWNGCVDSTTYKDRFHHQTCAEWKGFDCTQPGQDGWYSHYTDELEKECPLACDVRRCRAPTPPPTPHSAATCIDSPTWRDPKFNDTCAEWKGLCQNMDRKYSDELYRECPVACKVCDPASLCVDDTSYRIWGRTCAQHVERQWRYGWECDGDLKKACPVSCGICKKRR